MYRWTIQRLTRWVLTRLRRGETRWLLALMTDDVHFRFLGEHSWAADFRSKDQVREWLDRYVRTGLRLEPLEVVVSGPPWNTVVCTRFTDQAADRGGTIIYHNEGVLFDRIAWGRIREHVSYEDTQRTVAFDQRLAELSRPSRSSAQARPGQAQPEIDVEAADDHGSAKRSWWLRRPVRTR